jgi:triosephosphate isomerase
VRRPLIVGNWKMHKTLAEAKALAQQIVMGATAHPDVQLVVAPMATALATVQTVLHASCVQLAAQDIFHEDAGAYTGAIGAPFVADTGAHYALVGHSERRALFAESIADTASKLAALKRAGVCPILCVGETLAQREANETLAVVLAQLRGACAAYLTDAQAPLVVAYEPVWAIGTGQVATGAQAQTVHQALQAALTAMRPHGPPILTIYGGSVTAHNALELFSQPAIDGALVGGASLDAASFLAIARLAAQACE